MEKFHWLYDETRCFVCGPEYDLERCHLIPKSDGGESNINNLVLLSSNHHRQAPNISCTQDIMLNWIYDEAKKYSHLFKLKYKDTTVYYFNYLSKYKDLENDFLFFLNLIKLSHYY